VDIDDLTLRELKELTCLFDKGEKCDNPYKIGEKYLIRTVTMYYTGRLEKVGEKELTLSNAAWIADTGRYADALKSGELGEVEPIGDVIVGRGAIIDAVVWNHKLPKDQK